MTTFNLRGSLVWLTGASSGIGEALVLELARRGARVAITARRAEVLGAVAQRAQALGGAVCTFPGDVTSLDEMKEIANRIEREIGPIDLAIPNAGTHIFTKPEAFSSREYLELMNINYGGMLRCIEAVLPAMLERRRGYIAPVASLAGVRGLPTAAAYGASKSAMNYFLESMRFHVRRAGVTVTVINPGFVRTPLTDKNEFKMPFLVSAEDSARIICNGLERRKREIAFPWQMAVAVKLGRFLPACLYERIVDRMW
jgi:short-subunit dehydrogenase